MAQSKMKNSWLESLMEVLMTSSMRSKQVVGGVAAVVALLGMKRYTNSQLRKESRPAPGKKDEKKVSAKVDMEFFQRFKKFAPILVPGFFSREFFNMVAIAVVLMCRTWLDFWMIANNAQVLGAMAKRDFREFLRVITTFALMQLPVSIVNNLLKYLISKLSLNFRERLTNYMHKKYMKEMTYYSVSNLDNRIKNVDQLLTQDIEKFCTSLSNLYSNITKPLFDVVVFFKKLSEAFGFGGPATMLGYFLIAGAVMTNLRAPFGKYTAIQGKLEGDFRHVHSRIITHSEEIGFYGGNEREHGIIKSSFYALLKHINKYYKFRFFLGIFDSMATKYCATMLAYYVVTKPIFDPKNDSRYTNSEGIATRVIMEDYTKYMRLLIAMVSAVGRLVDAGREMSHFAGYMERIAQLNDVLLDLNSGKFQRTLVSSEYAEIKGKINILKESDEPVIQFEDVPIVTPNRDVLVRHLTFKVQAGMNTLITGPNGCGKSSLFRILGGLWPLYDGVVTRPIQKNLFYVPQRPYLAQGTLRDQVIYPETWEEAKLKGITDSILMEFMNAVKLDYVVVREGGWDSVSDWADTLSGGEKQRIAMARLFYHKPQFAILDECTSAVSVDAEGDMYNYCKKVGITLFTVSHRSTLWKYHEYLLKFDGKGGCIFKAIELSDYPADAQPH